MNIAWEPFMPLSSATTDEILLSEGAKAVRPWVVCELGNEPTPGAMRHPFRVGDFQRSPPAENQQGLCQTSAGLTDR